jgi:uncharacterized membrane protein YqjE
MSWMNWPDALFDLGLLLLLVAVFWKKRRWAIAGVALAMMVIGVLIDWPDFVRGFKDGSSQARQK